MPRLLYTLFYSLLMPLILLRMLWRSRKAPAYRRRWLERFGLFAAPQWQAGQTVIWLHAVSVGETLAAVPLVKTLQARHPDWQWVITTTTPTGSDRVRAIYGDSVFHVYAPHDLPVCVSAFLQRTQPTLCIIMETELWPNMLHLCRTHNIPSIVANARLSERSARGYARVSLLTHNLLQDITLVATQQATDGDRFIALGLPAEKMQVTGSIKFDLTIDDALRETARQLHARWSQEGTRPVWLAASTHHGEDAIILQSFFTLKKTFRDLLLVIAPRHPERFNDVFSLCEKQQWKVIRHSSNTVTASTDIIIGDTMGDLLCFYGAADMAFVGGSLVPSGGHNMIEPAAWACPVMCGPSVYNFSEVVRILQNNQAITMVNNAAEIAEAVTHWLSNPQSRMDSGLRAKSVADENRGALLTVCERIEAMIDAKMTHGKTIHGNTTDAV